ncbi:hypothetical protein GCM10010182_62610 [Actinomadura cremea]|nr:hypothetical protein GCM10010182_62610 [Actinomadura cremea]
MCRTRRFPHAEGMEIVYVPLAVAFAAAFAVFIVYGGIVMPMTEIAESWRSRGTRGVGADGPRENR